MSSDALPKALPRKLKPLAVNLPSPAEIALAADKAGDLLYERANKVEDALAAGNPASSAWLV